MRRDCITMSEKGVAGNGGIFSSKEGQERQEVVELVHTLAHPYCGDAGCQCHTDFCYHAALFASSSLDGQAVQTLYACFGLSELLEVQR